MRKRLSEEEEYEEITKTLNTLKNADLSMAPDRGAMIQSEINQLEKKLKQRGIKRQAAADDDEPQSQSLLFEHENEPTSLVKKSKVFDPPSFDNLYGLEQWYESLEPFAPCNTPAGLNVELKQHQKEGLPWMVMRECGFPKGGILADDMGLGKTISIISLILQQKSNRKSNDEQNNKMLEEWKVVCKDKSLLSGYCTLIVTPASVLNQWANEIRNRVAGGNLKVLVYHGSDRPKNPKDLLKHDIVLTNYNIIASEIGANKETSTSPLAKIAWERVVLDEAHYIKNRNTSTSKGCCQLIALKRWAVTGTPIHNSLWDLYSLVKFIHLRNLSEEKIWKAFIDNTNGRYMEVQFRVLLQAIVLRRMKNHISSVTKLPIVVLKERNFNLVQVKFGEIEQICYESIFKKAKIFVNDLIKNSGKSSKFDVSVDNDRDMMRCCLTILLRLRQCCVHFSLTRKPVDPESSENESLDDVDEKGSDMKIKSLDDVFESEKTDITQSAFDHNFVSAKMKTLFDELHQIIENGDKCVIVSQWTSLLDIIEIHLKNFKYETTSITGKIPTKLRQQCIDSFNNKESGAKIMLLSLNAGGTGLNLIGGNHLFLMDLHWNPALEKQVFDRIYRIGQEKNVFIHKLICTGTIEEGVLKLQENKNELAESFLQGKMNKSLSLNMNDMKFLLGLNK